MEPNVFLTPGRSTDTGALSTAWVLDKLIALLSDTVRDWDLPPDTQIVASTCLVQDLGCSSVDIIGIVVSIEQEFGARNLGFAELLFRDNRYVDSIRVGELARFVAGKLAMGAS